MNIQSFVTVLFLLCASSADAQDSRRALVTRIGETSMIVRVYNYASISSTELKLAESVTTDIFWASGVRIAWYDCGPSIHADNDPNCSHSTSERTLNLRICLNCTAFLAIPGHEVRGFATGDTATVSSEWTKDLSKTQYVASELVFGRVITHELGHVLLGPAHASVGIMKARWMSEDIDRGKLGVLMFTSQQGKLIRSTLKSRASTIQDGR